MYNLEDLGKKNEEENFVGTKAARAGCFRHH